MSPRTFVARSAAILSLAALGLAACESKTIVTPPTQSLAIVVSPASVTLTAAGQKAQFVALVTGGTADQVKTYSWNSSNTAVATVDANGVVTAVANGSASIIATTTADATVRAAGLVTVQIPVVVPPVVAPPTISIQSVMTNGGAFVDLTNVSGQINVALNVDVPTGNNVSKVETLIDGTTACSQTFTQGSSAAVNVEATNATVIVCSINTAALKADGTPVYANGAHTITARLVGPNGSVIANPATEVFVLNNDNALNLTVTPGKTATNPNDGTVWAGHGITVKVTPAIFGLTGNITDITVHVGYASLTKTVTSNTAPVTFVFSDSLLNAEDVEGMTVVQASSNLTTGFSGPSSPAPQIQMQIDEVGPHLAGTGSSGGGFNLNGILAGNAFWFGAGNAFTPKAVGFDPDPTLNVVHDNGVDNNVVKVQFSPNATTKVWTDAPATATTEAAAASLVMRIVACDALDNCTMSDPSPAFGIDVIAPKLADAVAPSQVNPAVAYTFSASDTGSTTNVVSGTPLNNIFVVEKVFTPTGTLCATNAAGATITMPSGGCSKFSTPQATGFTVPATEGYDSVTVFAVDSAGNKSATTTKLFLTDTHAPTISSILPANLTIAGGAAVTFNALVQDAIDIGSLTGMLTYGNPAVVALALPTQQLGTFGLPLENTQMTAAYVVNPFVTSMQSTLGAAGVSAYSLDATVTDQAGDKGAAGHSAFAPQLLLAPFVDLTQAAFDFGAAANGGVTSQALSTATGNLTLCVSTCGVAPKLKVDTLIYTIVQPVNAAPTPPFSSVTFYRQTVSPSTGPFTPIGTVTSGHVDQAGVVTITYTLVYTAATPAAGGTYNFIAVGTDSKGHGLMSNALTFTINP